MRRPYVYSSHITLVGLALAFTLSAGCSVQTAEPADEAGSSGRTNIGKAGAGRAGSSGGASGTAHPASDAGSAGEAGSGGDAGAGAAPCVRLFGDLRADTNVGPGCVSLYATTVVSGTLTIEAGTTLQVQPGGSLEVEDGAAVIAQGTVEQPIVFTSADPDPVAGDWQCLMIHDSPQSALDHVRLEYGGVSCGSVASSLAVLGGMKQLTHLEIQNGLGYGLRLSDASRSIRQLHDLTFSSIEKSSLLVTPEAMNALRPPIALDADDKYVDVDAGSSLDILHEITWHNVDLPYRFNSGVEISGSVTIEPGTILMPTGVVWLTTSGALSAVGTAQAPIRWTSAEATPAAGDWGCLDFTQEKTSRLEYNQFEYGGKCSYGSHQQVILVELGSSVTLKNLSFSHLPDLAIQRASGCPSTDELTQWCAFQYQSVKDRVFCDQSFGCK